MKRVLFIFYFFFFSTIIGQEINTKLLDSLTGEAIPYATVLSNFNQSTISNEEGNFKLIKDLAFTEKDSLFISCMGYKDLSFQVNKFTDSLVYLAPKEIELNAVILTQNNLTALEIIEKTKENIAAKYNLDLNKKTFFMRESFYQKWVQRDLEVKRSSIKEFNQKFWDSLFKSIPTEDAWHTESFGELYGDWSEENQKLTLKRAVELADTANAKGYDQIEQKITTVLDKQVKENSYFKFKSGIFSTKVDRKDVIEKPKDSTALAEKAGAEKEGEQTEEKFPEEESFYGGRRNQLKSIFSSFMKRKKLDISILNKSKHYDYEVVNFTYMEDVPVYQIAFKPQHKKGKYSGTLYIDADHFTLIQIDFKNVELLNDFSLFGLSFELYERSVQVKFNTFDDQKYHLQYLTVNTAFKTGIDRPFKVVEKNKFVRGRRKQNELKGDIHFKLNQRNQITLVVFDQVPMTETEFNAIEENKRFVPEKRNAYDPSFWEGFTIMEPNTAIKAFSTN